MTMMNARVRRRRRRQQQQQSIILLGILSLPSCSGFAGLGGPQLQQQTIGSTIASSLPWSTLQAETPPRGVRRSAPVLQVEKMSSSLGKSETVASAQAAEMQDILHEAMDLASSWEGYSTSQLSGLAKGILQQLVYMVENSPTEDAEPQEQVLHSQRVEKLEGHLEDFFDVIRARERGPTARVVAPNKRTGFLPVSPPKQGDDEKSSSSKVLHFLYKKQTPQDVELLAPLLGSVEEDILTPAMEPANEEVHTPQLLELSVDEDMSMHPLELSSVSEDERVTPLKELDMEEMPTSTLLETAAEKEELSTSLLQSEAMEVLETRETLVLQPSQAFLEANEVGALLQMKGENVEGKGYPVEAEHSKTALIVSSVATPKKSGAAALRENSEVVEERPLPFFAAFVTESEAEQDEAAAALPPVTDKEIESALPLADRLDPKMADRPLFGKLRPREAEPDLDWRSIMKRLENGFRRKNPPKAVIAPVKAETLVVPSSNQRKSIPQEEVAPPLPLPQEDLPSASEPLFGEAHWTTKQDWNIPVELQERPRLVGRQLAQSTTTTTPDDDMTVVVEDNVDMPFYDNGPLLGKSSPEMESVSEKGTSLWGGKTPVSLFGVQREGTGGGGGRRGGPLFGVRRFVASTETAVVVRPKFCAIDKAIGMLLVVKILTPAGAAAATVFGISKTNALLVYVVTMLNFFYFKDKFDLATTREQRFTTTLLWLSRFAFAFFGLR